MAYFTFKDRTVNWILFPSSLVHLLLRIISNAGLGSVGTDVFSVFIALFVLYILQFRWRVSYCPTCVLMQSSQHIQNPMGLTYVIHNWLIPFYRCFGIIHFQSHPLEFTSL
jgi:TctA family transporter